MPDQAKEDEGTGFPRLVQDESRHADLVAHYQWLYWLRSLKIGVCGGDETEPSVTEAKGDRNLRKIKEMSS